MSSTVPHDYLVRMERPDDREAVRRVLEAAFPTSAEADLVERLEAEGCHRVALVAERDERMWSGRFSFVDWKSRLSGAALRRWDWLRWPSIRIARAAESGRSWSGTDWTTVAMRATQSSSCWESQLTTDASGSAATLHNRLNVSTRASTSLRRNWNRTPWKESRAASSTRVRLRKCRGATAIRGVVVRNAVRRSDPQSSTTMAECADVDDSFDGVRLSPHSSRATSSAYQAEIS